MVGVVLSILLVSSTAFAIDSLPYSTRTRPYSGWSATVRGDIRTVGMAGATIGLAETFMGGLENPAGHAMTLDEVGMNFGSDNIRDSAVQPTDDSISSSSFVAGGNFYPWGWTLSYRSANSEGQIYDVSGQLVATEVSTGDFRASGARVFDRNTKAIGLSLDLYQGSRRLFLLDDSHTAVTKTTFAIGATAGFLFQLKRRWLVGTTYSFPVTIPGGTYSDRDTPGIVEFFQPIRLPYRAGIGVGWIPNRFFRFGLSTSLIGPRSGVALLSDNQRLVGDKITVQPRLGVHYQFVDWKELRGSISLGSYFEMSRIQGEAHRPHATLALELSAWIVNLGFGMDRAQKYNNFIFEGGIHLIRLMRKLDLLPSMPSPPRGGFLPNPFHSSTVGLARPLNPDWQERERPDIVEVTKELPKNLQKKLRETGEGIMDVFGADNDPQKPKAIKPIKKTPTVLKPKPGPSIKPTPKKKR